MTVEELEKAVVKLPPEELAKFSAWFEAYRAQEWDAWDRQLEADVTAGKLDKLIREAEEDITAGRTRPL